MRGFFCSAGLSILILPSDAGLRWMVTAGFGCACVAAAGLGADSLASTGFRVVDAFP
jgi:hypothetical protein